MAPAYVITSSKPPSYPRGTEPAQRSTSTTRSRDQTQNFSPTSASRKRSQSQEVSGGVRGRRKDASPPKTTSSTANPTISPHSPIDVRKQGIRTYGREGQKNTTQPPNGKLIVKSGAVSGKSSGPLKAFPLHADSPETASGDEVPTADLNGNYLQEDISHRKSASLSRRSSSLSNLFSPEQRPLPVLKKFSNELPLSVHSPKADTQAKSASKIRKGFTAGGKDSEFHISARQSRDRNERPSPTKFINRNPNVQRSSEEFVTTLEKIKLDLNQHSAKSSEIETETKSHRSPNAPALIHSSINGRGEVLGGRSTDLPREVALQNRPSGDKGLAKVRARRSSISSVKDVISNTVSKVYKSSGFQTETFILKAERNSEDTNETEDLITNSCDLKTKSEGSGLKKVSSKAGVVGLQNLGNTCFMNSVLQCLANTRSLLQYCLDKNYEKDINRSTSSMKGKMIKVYAELMEDMWRGTQPSVAPKEFKSEISNFAKQFVGYREQDAHEFLVYLLEALHEDINRVREKRKRIIDSSDEVETIGAAEKASLSWKSYLNCDNSQITDIFVGQLKSTLKCLDCNYISNTFEPFLALSLPLKKTKTKMSLLDCFRLFTQEEILDNNNLPRCAKCRTQKACTKQMAVHRFPKVLVIHLMRFKQGSSTKLTTEVTCPLKDFDLSEFSTPEAATGSSPVYSLYAVSNHTGSLYSGHYTAYAKNPHSQQWHIFNDRNVSPTSLLKLESGSPYLLFYERQEQST